MPAPALRFEVPTFDPAFVASITNYVTAICRAYRVRRADVFDVAQEALTKIFANVDSFRPEKGSTFDAWARGVALNVVRRHARHARRYGTRFSEYHPQIDDYATHAPSPEQCAQRKEARCAISNAMANLTANQASAVVFFDIDDMSHIEIGNDLGISEAASHKCHKRGREKLAQCLDRELLSVMPPVLTYCENPVSFNAKDSRWPETSHYIVQIAAAFLAVFWVSAQMSLTTYEPTTSDAQFIAPTQNAAMGSTDKHADVPDELVVLRDAPSGKPEPVQVTKVRDTSTPAKIADKHTYVPEYVPRLSYKHESSAVDYRPNGR